MLDCSEMKILGIVPARGGSKGVPRKNLRNVGGRSLIDWTAVGALSSQLDRIIVSTDDRDIALEAERCGIEVPFLRPDELSQDSSRSIDLVHHSLEMDGADWDAVMLLQPTSPFRMVSDINASIELLEQSGADSVVSVVDAHKYPPERMQFLASGQLTDFAEALDGRPRQERKPVYVRNGAIYLARVEVLKRGVFIGDKPYGLKMPEERSVNIDTELDLVVADAVARHFFGDLCR